jgi:hypothetical protein
MWQSYCVQLLRRFIGASANAGTTVENSTRVDASGRYFIARSIRTWGSRYPILPHLSGAVLFLISNVLHFGQTQ